MTTLLGLNAYQSEALVLCLAASLIWAGALLLGAMHLERNGAARGDRLWIGALLLAILPSLVAPSLAAYGVSLRHPAADINAPQAPAAATRAEPSFVNEQPLERPAGTGDAAAQKSALPSITLDQATGALSLLYIYGAFLALFIWLARQTGFIAAAALAEPVRKEALLRAVDDWAFDFGVKTPRLKRSRHVSSVCVYGAVSPVILMPHDLDARVADEDIALMCAHEIAHLKRGDTRLFTATALARVLFWFNPLITRIAANVEMAAEEGADRLVIGAGVDRRAYASCFVKGLKYAAMKQSLLPALAPGFTPNDRQARRRRLDQILSAGGERRVTFGARAALAGAASIAALLAIGQAAFAVDPEAAAEKKRAAELNRTEAATSADGAARDNGAEPEQGKDSDLLRMSRPAGRPRAIAPVAPEPPAPALASAPEPASPVEPAEPVEPPEPPEPVIVLTGDDGKALRDVFKGERRFAFGNGDSLTDRMAADLEHRLLGGLATTEGAIYDISFTIDGKSHRFTSDEPMTPEKRARLQEAIADMRAHREALRKQAKEMRAEWRKKLDTGRADVEIKSMNEESGAATARRTAFRQEDEARLMRRAAIDGERASLELELDAIADARADLADALADGIDEALMQIDLETAALEAGDASDEDRRIARQALAEARRNIENARRDHEREIERARRELERREAEIRRQIDSLEGIRGDGE
jgi:beta-lactamase regulating signal transducer with metallopeptidase domain